MARTSTDHLAARLREHVAGDVRFDALTRGLYATDASIYQVEPLGVVLPRSLDDVDATIAVAREEGAAVLPRGAGTSQCGQTVGRAVVVDASRHLRRVLEVDADARTATVEPGLVLDHLNRQLAPSGLSFPVDVATASRATLGGMAGNNSGGARSIRYGIMADNVLEVEATLPDGRVALFGPARTPTAQGRAAGPGPGLAGRSPTAADPSADLCAEVLRIARREADELERRVPKVMRHVAGYNLHRLLRPGASMAELLVGSEGTLAFFRSLKLKLSPVPARRVLGVCWFPSLADALDAVPPLVELAPHAVELLDDAPLRLARGNAAFRPTVEAVAPGSARSILLVEFAGDEARALSAALDGLEEVVRGLGAGRGVSRVEDPARQDAVWSVRRAALGVVMSVKGDAKPVSVVEDCAVPLERLREYAAAVEEVFARHGASGTWYAHASVGCLHVRPSLNVKEAAGVATLRAVAEEVHEVVRRLGGSHSGEHGDGILRSEFIEPVLGKRLAAAFQDVKRAFDPAGMMNPGKIASPWRMDDRSLLRYGPRYRARRLPLAMDWSSSGGFDRAVELCNNNGACRKSDPGVMCPSYRATQEEVDTTRGRANILRLAMTGQLGPDGLHGDEVAKALALCVGCKACRRECPAGVDMARMKAEVLHLRRQGRTNDGISARLGLRRPGGGHASARLRARAKLFATLPRWAPIASRAAKVAPRLANARNRSRAMAWVGARALGVAADAELPEWSRKPFRDSEMGSTDSPTRAHRSFADIGAATAATGSAEGASGPVVFFVDTFNRYFDPKVVRAGVVALRATGFQAVAPERRVVGPTASRPLCCARTYISGGFLDEARAELRRTVAVLAPMAKRGLPIVGLEPSCVLTLRDEAPDLVAGPDARLVARRSQLLDEFLASRVGDAERRSDPGQVECRDPETVAGAEQPVAHVHGHCHQKASGSEADTVQVLSSLAGLRAAPISASCCGMAGSFGYEAEHSQVSRAMGELGLLPAVRATGPDDVIVANGFSCRAQIRALAGRRAHHVAEVLARARRPPATTDTRPPHPT